MDFIKVTKVQPYQITTVVFCIETFFIHSKYNIGAISPLFDVFYLRISAVLKTLLPHINFPNTTLVRCSV